MYRNSRSCLSSFVRNRHDFLEIFHGFLPRQRPDLAIHKFTKLISENQEIPFYGDGSTARDYTFIEDIIDGVVKSVKYIENHHNVYETINLGESEVVNLNEMVTGIEQELGKSAIKRNLPMQPGDVENQRRYTKSEKSYQLFTQNKIPKWHKNFCGMVFEKQIKQLY